MKQARRKFDHQRLEERREQVSLRFVVNGLIGTIDELTMICKGGVPQNLSLQLHFPRYCNITGPPRGEYTFSRLHPRYVSSTYTRTEA